MCYLKWRVILQRCVNLAHLNFSKCVPAKYVLLNTPFANTRFFQHTRGEGSRGGVGPGAAPQKLLEEEPEYLSPPPPPPNKKHILVIILHNYL